MTLLEDTRRAMVDLPPGLRMFFLDDREAQDQFLNQVRCSWPIWSIGPKFLDRIGGLRIVPGTDASAWPIARGQRIHGRTLGSSLATSTTLLLCTGTFNNDVGARKGEHFLKARWPNEFRPALRDFHAAIGGDPALIDVLDDLLAKLDPNINQPGVQQFITDNLELLDPSPEQRVHAAFVREIAGGNRNKTAAELRSLLERYREGSGLWRNHIAWCTTQTFVTEADFAEVAWEILHLNPHFDTCFERPLAWGTGIGTQDTLLKAIVVVSKVKEWPEAWRSDPWLQIVYPTIVRDIDGPWHLSYMEAAAAYDGLEQPEMSWNMLCAGAFWVYHRGGPWRPFFDAAKALAERRGWPDCAWALNDMAERAGFDDTPG